MRVRGGPVWAGVANWWLAARGGRALAGGHMHSALGMCSRHVHCGSPGGSVMLTGIMRRRAVEARCVRAVQGARLKRICI